MARLIVVTHEYDRLVSRGSKWPVRRSSYLLFNALREFEKLGHSWRVSAGPQPVDGDAALLHVDATVVDPAYLALQSRYERTINFATGDISKRKVSSARLMPGDVWGGPVIVKGNLNSQGAMESKHNARALAAGRPLPHPDLPHAEPYRILDRVEDVAPATWDNRDLVVERFLPERDERGGYAVRTWVFMGAREWCNRELCADPIVKGAKVLRSDPVDVPREIRAQRERLNFDYGKFDFVIHAGVPILLDANRTPGSAPPVIGFTRDAARNLAEGLDEMIRVVDGSRAQRHG